MIEVGLDAALMKKTSSLKQSSSVEIREVAGYRI